MITSFEKTQVKKGYSDIKFEPGMIVRVNQKIREGDKERVQGFEGIIIKVNSGSGPNKAITVRKIVGGIGVEKIIPIHSPLIESIEIKRKMEVRRSKLYYLRDTSRTKKLYEVPLKDREQYKTKAKVKTEKQEEVSHPVEKEEVVASES